MLVHSTNGMNIRRGMGVNSYDDVVNTASVRQMSAISVRSTLSARSGHSPYIIKASHESTRQGALSR